MAPFVQTQVRTYLGSYDLTGDMNAVGLVYGAEAQDATAYGDTTRVRVGGAKTVLANVEGFWRGGADLDGLFFGEVGVVDTPMSFGPENGNSGEIGYTFRVGHGSFEQFNPYGETTRFRAQAECTDPVGLVRSTILRRATETTTGNGTAYQVGAIAAGAVGYAALHVVAASGTTPTLDVVIESDDNSGMTSATSRITFTQATAITSEWKTVAGAITDDYWRATFTIGGTTPSFTFALFFGIL